MNAGNSLFISTLRTKSITIQRCVKKEKGGNILCDTPDLLAAVSTCCWNCVHVECVRISPIREPETLVQSAALQHRIYTDVDAGNVWTELFIYGRQIGQTVLMGRAYFRKWITHTTHTRCIHTENALPSVCICASFKDVFTFTWGALCKCIAVLAYCSGRPINDFLPGTMVGNGVRMDTPTVWMWPSDTTHHCAHCNRCICCLYLSCTYALTSFRMWNHLRFKVINHKPKSCNNATRDR